MRSSRYSIFPFVENTQRPFVERGGGPTPKGCGLDRLQGSRPHSRVALVLCGVRGGGRTGAGPTQPALRPGCSAGWARGPNNLPGFPQTYETSGGSRQGTEASPKPQPRAPGAGRPAVLRAGCCVALRSCARDAARRRGGRGCVCSPNGRPLPARLSSGERSPQFQGWCVHWERRVSRGPHP